MAKIITSHIVGRATPYITERKPSALIPFKGDFPLLRPWKQEEFDKGIQTMYVDECPDWIQEILFKGERMATIDHEFEAFLSMNGILDEFRSMKSEEKATEFVRFCNANSLPLTCINVN